MKTVIRKFIDEKSMHKFELLQDRTINVVIGDFHMTKEQFENYSKKLNYSIEMYNYIVDAFERLENKYMKRGRNIMTSLDGMG